MKSKTPSSGGFGDILARWEKTHGNAHPTKDSDSKYEGTHPGDARSAYSARSEMPTSSFGDILARWEQKERFPPLDKDSEAEYAMREEKRLSAKALRKLTPEDSIDLHGMTRAEAWNQLNDFVGSACRRGLLKILIIHGKGNHSDSEGVLGDMVKQFIEFDHRLGASGHPDARLGGSGATWVGIKVRD